MDPQGIERGLRAAFGRRAELPPASVILRLAPDGRPRPPVLLNEEPSAPSPLLTPRSGTAGRYQIVGELARGGVGIVLKGHDVDLGRDVAMKVLREEHSQNPEVLHRFVEEAQIGGQLQHPGIVPVYELGLGAGDRPFFTMKLVKGRTLASLLAERDAEERRLLRIFESVCQTMAYAHSRGVIHRDLKPANVMVGAFGEVLVVDWGMGKVLGRPAEERPPQQSVIATVRSGPGSAPSEVGSVLGTPAYMPPEQARGEVDALDARADVFSLGAILCEILTGKPPYVGCEHEKAARASLKEAFDRLEACAADFDLVALAKACMAPAPGARPRDAAAVAAEMARFFASLEEKTRRSQTEAAEAAVRSGEERRRRKLVIGLAASVVALLGVGGGGWMWADAGRRAREERAARAVDEAVEEVRGLRGRAEVDGDAVVWSEAVSAARRADALAAGASPATRQRAASLRADVEAAAQAAADARERQRKDEAFAARLDEIRASLADTWDARAANKEYAQAFPEFGLDLGALPAEDAARTIGASAIRPRIVLAIDDWLWLEKEPTPVRAALEAVLARVDPDPWRARLREAKTPESLRLLAVEADPAALPAEALGMLMGRLGLADEWQAVADLGARAYGLHADNFWICYGAGLACHRLRRYQEALRYSAAAVALRPRSFSAHEGLGNVRRDLGDLEGAFAAYAESLRLKPGRAHTINNVGIAHMRQGNTAQAIAAFREILAIEPGSADAHMHLGTALLRTADKLGALAELREAVRLRPDFWMARYNLGDGLEKTGDPRGAVEALREAIRLRPQEPDSHSRLGLAMLRLRDFPEAVRAAREAVRLRPDDSGNLCRLGTALGANGETEAATAAYREAIRLDPVGARESFGNYLREKGNLAAAMSLFREAIRLRPDFSGAHNNLGICLLELRDFDGAIHSFKKAIEFDPRLPNAWSNLGIVLDAKGEFADAEWAFRKAVEVEPQTGRWYRELGTFLLNRGDKEGMIDAYRTALRLDPSLPDAPHHLFVMGWNLHQLGRYDEAAEAFREGRQVAATRNDRTHSGWGRFIADAERRGALLGRIDGAIEGRDPPKDAMEAFTFAELARWQRRCHAASTRFLIEALRLDPALMADPNLQRGFEAASAAVLAAYGRARDDATVTPEERERWRQLAVEWLRAELEQMKARFPPQTLVIILGDSWKKDPGLAGIRDEAQIGKLPVAEQEACRALWRDIDATLAKAKEALK